MIMHQPKKKKIVILGSTGSIGVNAVKIVQHLSDQFEVAGLAAYNNIELLARQANELKCANVATGNRELHSNLKAIVPDFCKASSGVEAIVEMVTAADVDLVLCAIVGTGGLIPVLEAIKAGKNIAIASKEILVMAGELVMAEAAKSDVQLIPVDSEHSAIFQCLKGHDMEDVSRLILTASGGAFRDSTIDEIKAADYKAALAHPTWDMGPKVTIDSATLMNKALEIVEARWLFDIPGKDIDVVIHPQSVIHSMVEFIDGTVLAQMSSPDMRFPIQYALTYPAKYKGSLKPLDFAKLSSLEFQIPDHNKFPSLGFAYEALNSGGTMPTVMNAANEVGVEMFRRGEISFPDIWYIIEKVMSFHVALDHPTLDAILSADKWARIKACEVFSS